MGLFYVIGSMTETTMDRLKRTDPALWAKCDKLMDRLLSERAALLYHYGDFASPTEAYMAAGSDTRFGRRPGTEWVRLAPACVGEPGSNDFSRLGDAEAAEKKYTYVEPQGIKRPETSAVEGPATMGARNDWTIRNSARPSADQAPSAPEFHSTKTGATYVDKDGATHWVDNAAKIPLEYRKSPVPAPVAQLAPAPKWSTPDLQFLPGGPESAWVHRGERGWVLERTFKSAEECQAFAKQYAAENNVPTGCKP